MGPAAAIIIEGIYIDEREAQVFLHSIGEFCVRASGIGPAARKIAIVEGSEDSVFVDYTVGDPRFPITLFLYFADAEGSQPSHVFRGGGAEVFHDLVTERERELAQIIGRFQEGFADLIFFRIQIASDGGVAAAIGAGSENVFPATLR